MNVSHNPAASQFEISTDAGRALLRYAARGDSMDLLHTEVPAAHEGKGVGSALVKAALEHARAEKLRVIPSCPFVSAYLRRHPEYGSLVAADP